MQLLIMAIIFHLGVLLAGTSTANAFQSARCFPKQHASSYLVKNTDPRRPRHLNVATTRDDRSIRLSCGFIDTLQNLFKGVSSTSKASASHILIKGGPEAATKLEELKAEIGDSPVKFEDAAAKYSDCSSASKGGDLGEFEPGAMVKEFDSVVFNDQKPIGVVHGPIKTEFGYHLILIQERT